MKSFIGSLIGLIMGVSAGAEPLLEGRVRLSSGQPAIGVQVRLFNLTDLRRFVGTTTDETGHFALPLRAFSTIRSTVLPTDFALGQNYPNPFNPSTVIPYQLPVAGHVRLEVFNLLGQRLATLVDGERSAGVHTVHWDATDAAGRAVGAGVYIYRLSSGGVSVSRRMVLVDGQAGIPAAGAATPGPMRSEVESLAEADSPVYGLTVSGEGLIPYVNPTFRVGVDEADLVIEEHGSIPRMKIAAGGILGDVDGNGQVDVFDVLYVLLYSEDSSIVLPNDGDISRGDVNGDGRVDIADAVLLLRYSSNPSDPTLPLGIGDEIGDEIGDDHGNTRSGATRIDLGSSTTGSLSEEDADYFVVEMPSAGLLVATTMGTTDTYGILLDESGNILAEDDDTGVLLNFWISADLSAGTYYIQVKAPAFALGGDGDYMLQVTDIHSEAKPFSLGGAAGGSISGLDDVDYFVVEMPSAGFLVATTTGSTDTYGILLDESGNPLAGDDDSGNDLNFLISTSVDAGTYYLRVGGFTSGNYTLFVQSVQNQQTTSSGGNTPIRLTQNASRDRYPVWSPDGQRIAFSSDRDGNDEIYVMSADGSNPIRLTQNASRDRYPVWSPDGQRIAFSSDRDGNNEIYVMSADGSNPTRLTQDLGFDVDSVWSPDGQRIAFVSNRDENYEIYVMSADGSNPTRLTQDPGFDGLPVWSPDGQRIAFVSDRDGNNEIYVMSADGSNPTRLTQDPGFDGNPAWSPDGQRIAFVSDRDGNNEIYVMSADGSNPTRLTQDLGFDDNPAWSPDGQRIAFESDRDGNNEIYVIDVD